MCICRRGRGVVFVYRERPTDGERAQFSRYVVFIIGFRLVFCTFYIHNKNKQESRQLK